jgi:predicted amidophosphoribosyltransferase
MKPPPWRHFTYAVTYRGAARRLLLIGKEGGRPEVFGDLARMLQLRLRHQEIVPVWAMVCAVPSRPLARWRRGYRPSELLAREVAKSLRIPYINALRRSWQDPARTLAASRHGRVEAAASAFSCTLRPRTGPVLLIDDVSTTGASLAACSRLLLDIEAGPVDVAVWARTPERPYNGRLPLEED